MRIIFSAATAAVLCLSESFDAFAGNGLMGEVTCDSCILENGLTVELRPVGRGSSAVERAFVSGNGSFNFNNIPEDNYSITVVSASGKVLSREFIGSDGRHRIVNLRIANSQPPAGQARGAIVSARRLAHEVPKAARKAFEQGEKANRKGELSRSIELLGMATSLDPEYVEAWTSLGCRYMAQNRFELALSAFGRAAALDPDTSLVHTNTALALLALGRPRDAETQVRRAMQADSGDRKARYVLALSLYMQGNISGETVEMLEQSADAFPKAEALLKAVLTARSRQTDIKSISMGLRP